MTTTAILLLVLSAVAHAGWNLAGKARHPSAAFFLIANVATAVCLSPVLFYFSEVLPQIPAAVWWLIGATGICQTLYFGGLGGAYRRGDLSLVYPMARAVPVVFVAIISITLGRGDQIGAVGMAGMVMVTAGCFILPLRRLRDWGFSGGRGVCCLFALLAAAGTTGYTLVDDEALRQLRGNPNTAMTTANATLMYMAMQAIATTIGLSVWSLLSREDRQRLRVMGRVGLMQAGVTGLIIAGTYGLALASMAYVTDVSYVAAFRQLSIPLGAMLGVVVLRERADWPKVIGVMVICAGLVLVAVG